MNSFEIALTSFLTKTAWAMEKPTAYGAFHLCFMIIGFFACGFFAWKLRNVGEKGNRRILLSIGLFLVLSEVYKQLFYTYVTGGGSYQWWIFPFQLCSIPMYFCLILPVLRQGRVKKAMYTFLMTFNFLGGLISFFEPSGLFHEYWTLTLHALLWHMTLVFLGLYVFLSKRGGTDKKDFLGAVAVFLGLCVTAFCINCIFWQVAQGDINMFYVGPRISPLAVFKGIAQAYGWYACTALYIPVLCVGAFMIRSAFCLVGSIIGKQTAKKQEKEKSLV